MRTSGSEIITTALRFPMRLLPELKIEIHNVTANCGCVYGQAVWNGHMVQRWYSNRCEKHSLRKKKVKAIVAADDTTTITDLSELTKTSKEFSKIRKPKVDHLKKKILELLELRKTAKKKSKERRAINARLLELANKLNELDPNAFLELQAITQEEDDNRKR